MSTSDRPASPPLIALRWILFVPVGVLAGFVMGPVAFYGTVWSGRFFGQEMDSVGNAFFSFLIATLVSGWFTVGAGAFVAPPKDKTIPAVAIAVVLFTVCGISMFVCATNHEWARAGQSMLIIFGAMAAMLYEIEASRPLREQHRSGLTANNVISDPAQSITPLAARARETAPTSATAETSSHVPTITSPYGDD